MKILFVAPVPPPYGGIANWTLLMKRYMERREDVSIVDVINTAPKQRDLDGRSLYERVVKQGFEMLRLRKKLIRAIKENKPDVVHITTSGQLAIIRDILFLKVCKKQHVRSLYHIRFGRIAEIAEANTCEWKMLKKAVALSDVTVPIDEITEATLKQYFSQKIVRIPNPFDLGIIKQLEKCKPKNEVMFLGWCVRTKGIEELLEAWSELSKDYSDWNLRIVGPYQETYLAELKEKYSCDRVIFAGEKDHNEAIQLMNQAGIFILPSYTEGFPNVVLEAMALRKPIIATDVGAINEMISGNSGLLIPPQNADAIENALKRLLDDSALCSTVADHAYARICREYSMDTVFKKYMSVWKGDVTQ